MVTRDREHAIPGAQMLQGPDIVCTGLGRTVGQIAGNQDQIRLQCVGLVHHTLKPGCLQQSAGMQVSELHNAQAIELGGQARQHNFQAFDVRHTDGLPHPHRSQAHADHGQNCAQLTPGEQGPTFFARQGKDGYPDNIPDQHQQPHQHKAAECPTQHREHHTWHLGGRHAAKESAGDQMMLGNQQQQCPQQHFAELAPGLRPDKTPNDIHTD